MTKQRTLILEILRDSQAHLDADALHNEARKLDPQIGLATVYRTLALLKEFGLVSENRLGDEHAHFETTPLTPHYHFTCLGCKKVLEFEVPCLDTFIEGVMSNENIDITQIQLSFEGYCPECQNNSGG